MKQIGIIIQARQGSSRFKNKILKKINGKYLILSLIEKVKKCKNIKKVVVAIPNTIENNLLNKILLKNKIKVFRGNELNVLKRYYDCSKKFSFPHILRITSDCPLIDINLIDKMAKIYSQNNYDYFSNILVRSFPDGQDLEFFSFKALEKSFQNVKLEKDKEHVTRYMQRSPLFKKRNFKFFKDYSKLRVTLDYKEDYDLIKKIIKRFGFEKVGVKEIITFYNKFPSYFKKNISTISKYENKINSGDKSNQLWLHANKVIAGGNSLFSKRPDVYIPNKWPTYFVKAKGCHIIGLNEKKYLDLSTMGVGTNMLGYANNKVDSAVKKRIEKGNMSTLNSIEEVKLADKLLEINSWAHKVRFTRTGGEANAVAIRLARASTKKNDIAFCGYHGWHDWYLAANLNNKKNLDKHLLSGLETKGVNKKLKGTIYPFKYNDFKGLKRLIAKNPRIGIIKMEVARNIKPTKNFLQKIRDLADKKKIILIFDECTTGFRECFGGLHKKYNINPDILILGKALGNGYAINAIIGKNDVMSSINNTFISSTFWTEASGFAAALKTLEIMEKNRSWNYVTKLGKYVRKKWVGLAKKNKIRIKVQGIPALSSFIFYNNNQVYKTFITQEMLKINILASNSIYISVAHNKKIFKGYFKKLNEIFKKIKKCEKGEDIFSYFDSNISRSSFKRLN
jgi:glutamate-1-semialdehyde 2,1-aminomutase